MPLKPNIRKLYFFVTLIMIFVACKQKNDQTMSYLTDDISVESDTLSSDSGDKKSLDEKTNYGVAWEGSMDGKIPVTLWYDIYEPDIVVGKILYKNSPNPIPITLIGTISNTNHISLNEFDNKGMITGRLEGVLLENQFNPEWFSPETQKMRMVKLTKKDTLITSPNIDADKTDWVGNYHFAFGSKGYSGDLEVLKVEDDLMTLRMLALSSEATGYHTAELDETEINILDNTVKIAYPMEETCSVKVSFYRGFAIVVEDNCGGQFGQNASLAGIYYKID